MGVSPSPPGPVGRPASSILWPQRTLPQRSLPGRAGMTYVAAVSPTRRTPRRGLRRAAGGGPLGPFWTGCAVSTSARVAPHLNRPRLGRPGLTAGFDGGRMESSPQVPPPPGGQTSPSPRQPPHIDCSSHLCLCIEPWPTPVARYDRAPPRSTSVVF